MSKPAWKMVLDSSPIYRNQIRKLIYIIIDINKQLNIPIAEHKKETYFIDMLRNVLIESDVLYLICNDANMYSPHKDILLTAMNISKYVLEEWWLDIQAYKQRR